MANFTENEMRFEVADRIKTERVRLAKMAEAEHPACVDCGEGSLKLWPIHEYEQVGKEWKLNIILKCTPCRDENGFAPKMSGDMIEGEI